MHITTQVATINGGYVSSVTIDRERISLTLTLERVAMSKNDRANDRVSRLRCHPSYRVTRLFSITRITSQGGWKNEKRKRNLVNFTARETFLPLPPLAYYRAGKLVNGMTQGFSQRLRRSRQLLRKDFAPAKARTSTPATSR